MADYSISAELELNTSGYQSGIKNAEKTTKSFSDKIKETIEKVGNNGLTKSMANLTLAVGGVKTAMNGVSKVIKDVTKAVKECSDAYKTQYKAEVQLETAAQNNPFLNSSSVQQLKEYASEMQRISTMGDEQILPYMAQLAAAGRTQEQIQKIVKTALDVSASGAMSFESAVKNLNKTYSGLAGEIGESIPDIKTLTQEQLKNGDAIDLVASKYAGLAEATAKATGSAEQLSNAWGDFKENIGKGFEEKLAPVRTWLTGIISQFNEAIAKRDKLSGAKEADDSGTADIAHYNSLITEQAKKIASLQDEYNELLSTLEQRANALGVSVEEYMTYENAFVESTKENLSLIETELKSEQEIAKKYSEKLHYLQLLENIEAKRAQAQAQANAEAEAQAERDRIALEAKQKYADTLSNFEQEIELRKIAGEEITREQYLQEKINVAKSAFIQMVKDGQGYITENNQGWKDAVALLAEMNAEYANLTAAEEEKEEVQVKSLSYAEQYAMAQKNAQEYAQKVAEETRKNNVAIEDAITKTERLSSTWDDVKSSVSGVSDAVKNVASFATKTIKGAFSLFTKLLDFNRDEFLDSLLEFEDKLLSFFHYTLPQLPLLIKNAFSNLIGIISQNYQTWVTDGVEVLKDLFTDLLDNLTDWVESGGFQEMVLFIVQTLKDTIIYLVQNLDKIIELLVDMSVIIIEELLNAMPEILVELIKNTPQIAWAIIKGIGQLILETFGSIPRVIVSMFTGGYFATGTNNAPRGLAIVGEQGPELVDFNGGERVYTASNTKQILSGSGGGNSFNVTFNNVQDTSASAMMRELRRYNRELAINGVI